MKKTGLVCLWLIFSMSFLSACQNAGSSMGVTDEQGMSEYGAGTETDAANTAETAASNAVRDYPDFFAEEMVHDLYVELADEDWEAILADPEAKEYYPAAITIEDTTISQVGFRTRGNSSLRMARRQRSERYPFRLKFDEYVEDQRFLELDELILTNSNDDPSYLREYLGYEAFRQIGMEAPLVTFFNLYVNGELRGLYVGVEAIDNRYLNRVFGEHEGNLYEAGLQATLETDMELEILEQKKGTDESKQDVEELIRILNDMPEGEKGEIEDILNVDSVLQYMAGNAVLHNWDDYAGQFAHNFYLYMYEGKFQIIPWDMNEGFLQTEAYYRESDGAQTDILTPITGESTLEERPLVENLFAVPEYYEQYLAYCETLRQWLETLPEELEDLYARIAPSVEADATGFFTYEEFEQQFDADYSEGLAGFITEREQYLEERIPELSGAY